MSLRKSSAIAIRSLRRNRLQTILTTVGMMIGVGTVVVMIAVGSGAQSSIRAQVRAAGMNVIQVNSGNYKMPQQWTSQGEAEEPAAWSPQTQHPKLHDGVFRPAAPITARRIQSKPQDNPIQSLETGPDSRGGLGGATTLTLDDAAAVAAVRGVQTVSGGMHDNANIAAGDSSWLTLLRGEEVSLIRIRRAWILTHGRFFTDAENTHADRVVVLGSVAAEHIFGTRNPVGESVTLRDLSFKVIGVVASGSWMVPASPGDGQFDAAYIPVKTMQQLMGRSNLDSLTLSTESAGDVVRVTKDVTALLRSRHHLGPSTPDDFTVVSQARHAIARGGMRTDISRAMMGNAANLDHVTLEQLSKTLEHASRTMAILLASIATVSLIVGGIGIMNIMLLAVTERTREIGIRRAVGAESADVMRQFLFEALYLSLSGGILGVAVGVVASFATARYSGWSVDVSLLSVILAFTVSAAIGVAFGYYPAQQASRVSPMTSLRYE